MDRPSSTTAGPWWLVLATLFGGAFILQGGRGPQAGKDETRAAKAEAPRASGDTPEIADTNRLRRPLLQFLGLPSAERHADDQHRFDFKLSLEASDQRR